MAIAAALVMAPVAPEAGNILFLVAGAVAIFGLRPIDLAALSRPVILMPLLGLFVLGTSYALGAGTITGFAGLLAFAPLLAIWPLVALGNRGTTLAPSLVAALCLVGVAGTMAIALNDFLLTGSTRAGGSIANPIHFADVALLAGFLSLLGMVYLKPTERYLYLLGPVMAGVAVVFSGTRGAIVALVVMAGVAVACAALFRQIRMRTLLVATTLLAVFLLIGFAAGMGQISGVQRILADVSDVLRSGVPSDGATAIRLSMYQGGLDAFLASPLFGHGPFAFVDAAAATQSAPLFVGAPHLHSDLIDFAASGGSLALIAYCLFLFAPLVEVLRAPASDNRAGLIIVVAALTAGYFVMGLTNAMFGILNLTVYFAAICVVVGLLSRSHPDET